MKKEHIGLALKFLMITTAVIAGNFAYDYFTRSRSQMNVTKQLEAKPE